MLPREPRQRCRLCWPQRGTKVGNSPRSANDHCDLSSAAECSYRKEPHRGVRTVAALASRCVNCGSEHLGGPQRMPTTDKDQPIRILHLSDIHFRAGKAWDAEPVLRKLTGFIETEVKAGLAPDLVAITGDLAFAGIAEEYALARTWLDDLWKKLGDPPRDRLLLVPGNHDVDRKKVDPERRG